MPKRTNDFQALIALVERQLATYGVRVVESEMLADRLTGELREVDVRVHAIVSGKEGRSRSSAATTSARRIRSG